MTKNNYHLNIFNKYSTHNIILNSIGVDKIVLDVGCNEGYIGKNSDKSNIFYGIDYFKDAINKTKKSYKDAIFYDLNKIENLPWDIEFDVIIFADVLEHVFYPEKILKFFVSRYLKKNGKVIISLPNIANWQIRFKLLFGKFDYKDTGIMDKTHLHLYTYKNAVRMVLKNNIKIINILCGASIFGPVVKGLPFLRYILATNIIIIGAK